MYYFYILYSQIDNGYYYGSTSNLKKRLNEHQQGNVPSTSYRRPLNLAYYETYTTVVSARKREKQVKNSSSIRAALHKRFDS